MVEHSIKDDPLEVYRKILSELEISAKTANPEELRRIRELTNRLPTLSAGEARKHIEEVVRSLSPEYRWSYGRNAHLLEIDEPRAVKLVEMHPKDFLELAAPMTFDDERMARLEGAIRGGADMELPWLEMTVLEDRSCRVTGHEGRHRAEASRRLGIDRIPVLMYLRERVKVDDRYHYPFLDWALDPCCHHQEGKASGKTYLVCHATEQAGDMTLGKDGWVGPAPAEDLDVLLIERIIDWEKTPLARAPPHWRREHGLGF